MHDRFYERVAGQRRRARRLAGLPFDDPFPLAPTARPADIALPAASGTGPTVTGDPGLSAVEARIVQELGGAPTLGELVAALARAAGQRPSDQLDRASRIVASLRPDGEEPSS